MSTQSPVHTDYIIDRRRLRRKLTFWRVLAFIVIFAALLLAGWRVTKTVATGSQAAANKAHIARVKVTGLITGDPATMKMLDRLGKSKAKAIILSIESPGGTTTGAERLFNKLRQLNKKKPVVAVVGNVAASGAYIAALSSDHIVASGNSLVGSIGVLIQLPNVSSMLDKIGVKVDIVRSTPLKAAPSGLEPDNPQARKAMASIVDDSYLWFKKLVQQRRAMSPEQLAAVSDGRVFTGRQSIKLKLIDAIGDESHALAWLQKNKKISKKLPIRDWKKKSRLSTLGRLFTLATLVDFAGFPDAAKILRRAQEPVDIQSLDGLLAVWQSKLVN